MVFYERQIEGIINIRGKGFVVYFTADLHELAQVSEGRGAKLKRGQVENLFVNSV